MVSEQKAFSFLGNGGQMGQLIREFEWANTTLGPVQTWPACLKHAMSLMLQSPVPLVMLWGPDGIMIYNDAYSVFAGERHPHLLGSKVVVGWPEVADFNRHVMETCLVGGQTLSYSDQELLLERRDGAPEPAWMDLNYSPILNDSGRPAGVMAVVVETTQRIRAKHSQAQAETALKAERERLHTLFMQAPAVIAVLQGPNHVFELANPMYNEITGQRALLNSPIREVLPELEGQQVFEILDTVYRTGIPFFGNEVALLLDRENNGHMATVFFNFVYQPYNNLQGNVEGILVHAVDVTEQVLARKKIEERAKEQQRLISVTNQRNELIKLNQAKDQFISLASHQLRTPATAVKQYTSLLLSGYAGALTADQATFLQKAYDSNERQLNIITELLKTAQIDSNHYVLQKAQVSLRHLLEELITALHPTLELKNQTVKLNAVTDVVIMADPNEMQLVFANLLDNASKYSHPGKAITITLKKTATHAEIIVADAGVGISPANLKHVFEKFTRIDNELSDTVTGSGLGLYWVKKIVKLHQGTIKVQSTAGKGATFTVRLPL